MITADKLRFRFGEIEGHAVAFRERADNKYHKAHWLVYDIPHVPITAHAASLHHRDLFHAECSCHHDEGDDRQTHSQLVANHLRRSADGSQQGEFIVGCPSTDHDTVNANRHHGKNIKDTDIDIGDLKTVLDAIDLK